MQGVDSVALLAQFLQVARVELDEREVEFHSVEAQFLQPPVRVAVLNCVPDVPGDQDLSVMLRLAACERRRAVDIEDARLRPMKLAEVEQMVFALFLFFLLFLVFFSFFFSVFFFFFFLILGSRGSEKGKQRRCAQPLPSSDSESVAFDRGGYTLETFDVFFPCVGGVPTPMLDGITERLGKLRAALGLPTCLSRTW